MFTICISFPTLITKAQGMCEGASKQSPDLKDYMYRYRNGTAPPGSYISGSTTKPYIFCCRHIRSLDEVHKTKNYIYVHSGSIEI